MFDPVLASLSGDRIFLIVLAALAVLSVTIRLLSRGTPRNVNPFKPPSYVRQYEALNRTGGGGVSKGSAVVLRVIAIMLCFTVVGIFVAIPMFLMAAAIERGGAKLEATIDGLRVNGKAGRWFDQLAATRNATFADIGTYLGGHPWLLARGKCALYTLPDELLIESQDGQQATIPYSSIQSADLEVFADGSAIGAVRFQDDRGGIDIARVTGTWGNPVIDWVNFLNAARYHGRTEAQAS